MYAKIAIHSDGTGILESVEAFDKPGPGLVRWYGGANADGLTWGDRLVNLGDLVLPLPAPASGCRDIHRPLLDLFRRELGSGVPLDSLAGGNNASSEAWEIIEDERPVIEVDLERDGISWAVCNADDLPSASVVREVIEWACEYGTDDCCTVYVALSDDDEVIGTFEDEYDAEDAVRERREESRYGYPWAHGWAYYVEDRHLVDDLRAAGFVVAEQTETGHLFCGVDGGGYDFQSAHHVVFAALRLARYGDKVKVGDADCIPVGPVRS